MPRIEINLPDKFLFSTRIPIRIGEINRAAHLSHVFLVQILEEARAQFLVSLGYGDEVNIHQGLGFILGDLGVIFKGQAYYGQSLLVEITAVDFKNKSFDLVYRVTNSVSGQEVAAAKTAIITFDYHTQKSVPVPEDLKKKLTKGV
jgi:acyl-CoA thioesterase FadM